MLLPAYRECRQQAKDLRKAYEERVEMSEQAIEECEAKMKLDAEKTVRKIRAEVSIFFAVLVMHLPFLLCLLI